jgi:sugar lactone lactonase YvrE
MEGPRLFSHLLAAVLFGAALTGAAAEARDYGDVRVLAQVPQPGFPEGIAVENGRVYVSGPAHFGTAGNQHRSPIWIFDAGSGALLDTIRVQGEDLTMEHANSCLAFDGLGRLYVLNTQFGVLRFNLATKAQSVYSPLVPDLPACNATLDPAKACAPTIANTPPLTNDLAFDPAGNLYITDSLQATIWKVPAGGGPAQIWFQDKRLSSPYVGVNGIRLNPARTRVFFSVTTDRSGYGYIYSLPLVAKPMAADLKVFHKYDLGESPDGIAFASDGKLYVTLALPMYSGLSVLRPDGSEELRLVNNDNPLVELSVHRIVELNLKIGWGSPIAPYDSPANLAFTPAGSALVTNHAFATMLPQHFRVLDVFVNDTGSPLVKPVVP